MKKLFILAIACFCIAAIAAPAFADGVTVEYAADGSATILVPKDDADALYKKGGKLPVLNITGEFTGWELMPMEKQADGSYSFKAVASLVGNPLYFSITSGKGEGLHEFWLPQKAPDFIQMAEAGKAKSNGNKGAWYVFSK